MTTDSDTDPVVDRRLWWQKRADGIADGCCAVLRFLGGLFSAWAWWHDSDLRDP